MKTSILSFFFLLIVFTGTAQISVSNATFPAVGDTLKTVLDGMPANITINPTGGAIGATWSFGNLQGVLNETIYLDASEGTASAEFPGADLVANFGLAGENYYRITNNTFEFIGYQGPDPANLGLNLSVHIDPPLVEKRAALNFTDNYTDDGAILVPVAADDIPGGILDSFPIAPDSLRLRVAIERSGFVEGWGNLTIPGGTFEVLREKRVDLTETRLDVKIGIGPFSDWVDVTDIIGLDFLGADTTTTYNFYGETSKEPIAVVTVDNEDNDQVQFVEYKYIDGATNVRYVNDGKPNILAYPNPAIDEVRLEFMNLPSGNYEVRIYNILGVEVWQKEYSVSGDRMVKINLSNFRKGTYLYSLTNDNGKIITTKRLVVLRP